ncbi:hypothetical protein Q765_19500 [Flavobacterium rivuli WB 3.3-2 = DSM 21788]|uniref:LUD domain-containing protein n=1 Tax=Flavobacterium rivuli WB 3.3-2 = DSM 21788 TaxID=1121895 RepID=A0A0A2LZS1_9FLAO|nr:LUD domain-containing protein [Flavobacterium rivuli]KGO84841.1 hypothetical protein Q765_19500 [Flavobacterium rivuli WB 3.3-2 = DSM 21788]
MSSRNEILAAIAANKPDYQPLPVGLYTPENGYNIVSRFKENITLIGGAVHKINVISEIEQFLYSNFPSAKRIVTNNEALKNVATHLINTDLDKQIPHELENVDVTILDAPFGVAENGAIWITDESLHHRVLPFITQHLILIIKESSIIASLQDAYAKIGLTDYGYGTFISGPSKTADIEQSLVIGAHGSRSLDVFIIGQAS